MNYDEMNNKLLSLMIENAEALKQNTQQQLLDLMKSTIRNEVELAVRNEIEVAARDEYEKNKEKEPTYILNYQMPQTRSKTSIALNHVVKSHALVSQNPKGAEKLISIVMANNSLLETFAWGGRTAAKLAGKEFNITRIASNAKTAQGEFYNDEGLINAYTSSSLRIHNHIRKKENTKQPALPADIIIMCNNNHRMKNLETLITELTNLTEDLHIKFKFNIIFDECDKYTGPIIKFIETLYNDKDKNKNKSIKSTIDNIQFISGTMKSDFLNKLSKISVKCEKLLNLAYDSESSVNNEKVSVPLYKTVLNQKHIPFEGPTKPIKYLEEYDRERGIELNKIYFVPGENKVETHNEISEFFRRKGLYVLILNGKEKKILSPYNSENENYDITRELGKPVNNSENSELTELRHILINWRKKHNNKGLAITGCNVLERGLTFLTDGFCFDYMIISGYFSSEIKSIGFLIQLLGRGQGAYEFVDNFELFMPMTLHNDAKAYIQRSEEVIKSNVEYYTLDHFEYVERGAKTKKIDTFCLVYDYSNFHEGCLELHKLGYRINIKHWKDITDDVTDKGFIQYKFRGPKHVWSMSEVLRDVGGFSKDDEKDERRPYPCYESLDDKNTLKWVIRCKNTDTQIKVNENKLIIGKDKDDKPIFSELVEKIIIE